MYQGRIYKKIVNEIHLDLYVDESKNRIYKNCDTNEIIDYIMIMAVPLDKKDNLYNKLNNARCLSDKKCNFDNCKNKCNYHSNNDTEIHYNEISRDRTKIKIANNWLDILIQNNKKDEKSIYFNILGIIESNLSIELFGEENVFGNIYTRFFRTALLKLLSFFKEYDKIIIENIYHDSTTEMENHKYFKTSVIKKIRIEEFLKENSKINFKANEIEFIDSNHRVGKQIDSQFIQFVDLILGTTCNVIHNDASNINKKKITEKIYPLIQRMLDKKLGRNKNSEYNYFNKQIIGFFPCVSKEELKRKCKEIYGVDVISDEVFKDGNFFINNKQILYKLDDGQCSFFEDYIINEK